LENKTVSAAELEHAGLRLGKQGGRRSVFALMGFTDIDAETLDRLVPQLLALPSDIRHQVAIEALYAPYESRQASEAEALRRDEEVLIPSDFDYAGLPGLSSELCMKLGRFRPENLAQAARLEGMTPAALTLLLARLKHQKRARAVS
jgi:tRNA uridine 5-carboxymethylaminomethyl modification enzyme